MKKIKKSVEGLAKNTAIDLLIIGSGTGITTALAGHEKNLKSLIIEKTQYVGGSTALSGGAFWIPANPVLTENGSKDTLEKAEKYLQALAAGLFAGATNNNIPIATNSKLVELLMDGDRVVGAVVEHDDKKTEIHVSRGVVLAAGGFDHNMPMRHKYQSKSLGDHYSFG